MVYFTCDGCNETLKKNQVDAHVGRCRKCNSVSCVDCYVSFYGDDFRAHTACITEAEKYEGKGSSNRPVKRNPQQEWMDMVEYCGKETAPASLKSYFNTMMTLDNIPRKEKQFRNFTSNSLKLRGPSGDTIVSEIWSVLNEEKKKRMKDKEEERQKAAEARAAKVKAAPKKAVVENSSDDDSDDDDKSKPAKKEEPKLDKKKVMKAAKKTLKKAPNRSMKIKDLRNSLLKQMALPKSLKKDLQRALIEAPTTVKKTKVVIDGKLIVLK